MLSLDGYGIAEEIAFTASAWLGLVAVLCLARRVVQLKDLASSSRDDRRVCSADASADHAKELFDELSNDELPPAHAARERGAAKAPLLVVDDDGGDDEDDDDDNGVPMPAHRALTVVASAAATTVGRASTAPTSTWERERTRERERESAASRLPDRCFEDVAATIGNLTSKTPRGVRALPAQLRPLFYFLLLVFGTPVVAAGALAVALSTVALMTAYFLVPPIIVLLVVLVLRVASASVLPELASRLLR